MADHCGLIFIQKQHIKPSIKLFTLVLSTILMKLLCIALNLSHSKNKYIFQYFSIHKLLGETLHGALLKLLHFNIV